MRLTQPLLALLAPAPDPVLIYLKLSLLMLRSFVMPMLGKCMKP